MVNGGYGKVKPDGGCDQLRAKNFMKVAARQSLKGWPAEFFGL